ncbi:MAG: hypothetical protein IMX05_00390 [Hydrogenibacillus schlegelii]|nr:hypothetical protein [Hydrogenibacillus schlegelii]
MSSVIKGAPLAGRPLVLVVPPPAPKRPAAGPGPSGGALPHADRPDAPARSDADPEAERAAILAAAQAEAAAILEAARAEAEAIRTAARKEAERLTAEARAAAEAEGYRAGYAAGDAAGRRAAEAAYAERLAAVAAARSALEAEFRAALDEALPALVRLALQAAEKVVRRALSDDGAWVAYAREILLSAPLLETVTVYVPAERYAALVGRRSELAAALPEGVVLRLLPATDLVSGVRVATDGGIIDASVEGQIERLAAALLEAAAPTGGNPGEGSPSPEGGPLPAPRGAEGGR